MHHLHLVTVKAEDHEDAQDQVSSFIDDWGNENNWNAICGSVCEDGSINVTGDGRFPPEENETFDSITKVIEGWISETNIYSTEGEKALDLLSKGELKLSDFTNNQWWSLKNFADQMYQKSSVKLPIDLKIVNYFEYNLDEIGITNCVNEYKIENEELQYYVVFVDFHS